MFHREPCSDGINRTTHILYITHTGSPVRTDSVLYFFGHVLHPKTIDELYVCPRARGNLELVFTHYFLPVDSLAKNKVKRRDDSAVRGNVKYLCHECDVDVVRGTLTRTIQSNLT